jgi:hypothetical protein
MINVNESQTTVSYPIYLSLIISYMLFVSVNNCIAQCCTCGVSSSSSEILDLAFMSFSSPLFFALDYSKVVNSDNHLVYPAVLYYNRRYADCRCPHVKYQ